MTEKQKKKAHVSLETTEPMYYRFYNSTISLFKHFLGGFNCLSS